MRKEQMDLQTIKDKFFDPELMRLVSEYLLGKQYMIMPVTLGAMIGASAGRLIETEQELHDFIRTIAAIITSSAEHSFSVKTEEAKQGVGGVKH